MAEISIAIVDDQNLFRQSLALLVNSIENFTLVAECTGGQAFIDTLKTFKIKPDIAIIDMDMPGINGIGLNKYLHVHHPAIKVIILTVHANETLITQMIDGGAASYLVKNCDKDELLLTINTVYKNGFYFNADVIKALRNSANHRSNSQDILNGMPIMLSKREGQVLNLICKEFNNTEIAAELYLSVRTVEGHRIALINKIKCRNTAGLVLFALKHRLVDIAL
ncbi:MULTISPECIES: response regulator transcription factor [unclassified Mucilaginibacter]|uniref:response regulator transcription factor n=1 Tax=unclassified Mucilaginibacter TaxID=2617802 RepID=UPI002AC8A48A|nr:MULTISPECIES: response regulator transcription factor [unclassified Mucilaginibacter]MEB0263902.1 response regulator transcription factor [Mucilaginibacter sp. 10I4]MEB0279318.1 response regulator transcription factor [Mucilaginibacter sp. 10B2]MEB0302897.1 response regulator transcription factor [Mucilaginibacter sp. 5C4]WPX23170.1 response regulator transcription factor [Mucilaginibacter sp. 5C4]